MEHALHVECARPPRPASAQGEWGVHSQEQLTRISMTVCTWEIEELTCLAVFKIMGLGLTGDNSPAFS